MEGEKADEARKKITKAANKASKAATTKKAAASPEIMPPSGLVEPTPTEEEA
jgi:hypothetical protein